MRLEFSAGVEAWQAPVGIMLARAEELSEALSWIAAEEAEGELPVARWLSKRPYGDDWDISLSASPISVAAQLRSLWSRCYGAVVTSATLTALNSFNSLKWEAGLPDWAVYERVASPFNCGTRAAQWFSWRQIKAKRSRVTFRIGSKRP